ncbi:MAG: GIN domain-containing protein, partial [Hyphococcus sp.]
MKKLSVLAAGWLAIAMMNPAFADGDITRELDLTGFEEIDISGVYELDVRVGADYAIRLSGPEDEMERVEASVEDGVLHLDMRGRQRGERDGVEALITMPMLRGLEVSGVVDGVVTDIDAEAFE